jgi:hypothetical protein
MDLIEPAQNDDAINAPNDPPMNQNPISPGACYHQWGVILLIIIIAMW